MPHGHAKHGWLCASMAQEPARRARHVSVMSPNENVVYLSQFMLRFDKVNQRLSLPADEDTKICLGTISNHRGRPRVEREAGMRSRA